MRVWLYGTKDKSRAGIKTDHTVDLGRRQYLSRLVARRQGDRVSSHAGRDDGKLIAFASNRNVNYQIFVMNRDGTDVRLVANTEGRATAPLRLRARLRDLYGEAGLLSLRARNAFTRSGSWWLALSPLGLGKTQRAAVPNRSG